MNKSRYTDSQILSVLMHDEGGTTDLTVILLFLLSPDTKPNRNARSTTEVRK